MLFVVCNHFSYSKGLPELFLSQSLKKKKGFGTFVEREIIFFKFYLFFTLNRLERLKQL
jgi:hypothetical protein